MPWRTSVWERAKLRGWSQNRLAREMGIDPAQISRVVNGQQTPGAKFQRGAERAFPGVAARDLVWYEDEPEKVTA